MIFDGDSVLGRFFFEVPLFPLFRKKTSNQERGKGGGITFDTGVQQGSVLSPTLFNLFLNPLLRLLTAIGQQRGISHGIRGIAAFNNLAFADDLTIVAETRRLGVPSGGAQRLLQALEEFSKWSGMEVKIVKSCGMWVGAERDLKLPLTLKFREQQLKIVLGSDPVRYLGFFQSRDGDWNDMVRRVLEETKKACDKLELHPLNADEAANLVQSIVISTFRRPATLVPWSTQELGRLEQLWQTAYKEVWHLMKGTCADIFMFPSHAGGMQYPRPMAILWEATSRHIERDLRHDDVARQIIRSELESALDLWTCTSWQDLVDEAALRSWEESRQNIFLRLAKNSHVCRMKASELPVGIFGEANEGISLMAATRQLRRATHRWKEMSGDWQTESSHARAVVHSGRSPGERDTTGKVIMGQGHKGRAHFHARVITARSATLTAAAAPIPGRKYGESSRHDIWENGRGPKRHTGYEGMGPGAQAIEGQGSHNAAKHFGPHGLAGSPHDRHTRHSAAIYRVGS